MTQKAEKLYNPSQACHVLEKPRELIIGLMEQGAIRHQPTIKGDPGIPLSEIFRLKNCIHKDEFPELEETEEEKTEAEASEEEAEEEAEEEEEEEGLVEERRSKDEFPHGATAWADVLRETEWKKEDFVGKAHTEDEWVWLFRDAEEEEEEE